MKDSWQGSGKEMIGRTLEIEMPNGWFAYATCVAKIGAFYHFIVGKQSYGAFVLMVIRVSNWTYKFTDNFNNNNNLV